MKIPGVIKGVYRFYYNGFTGMSSWGKKSWIVVLVKLFIMFAILRIFFFHDFLDSKFDNDADKVNYVMDQIINYQ